VSSAVLPENVSPDACATIFHDDHQTFRTNSASFATLPAIRPGIMQECRCYSGGLQGGGHEAFAVHPGSFRRYRLHRIPSIGSVCFPK
jgi:hypothetical protein